MFNPRLKFYVCFATHLGDGRMCFLYGGEEEKLFPGGRFIIRVAVFRVSKPLVLVASRSSPYKLSICVCVVLVPSVFAPLFKDRYDIFHARIGSSVLEDVCVVVVRGFWLRRYTGTREREFIEVGCPQLGVSHNWESSNYIMCLLLLE